MASGEVSVAEIEIWARKALEINPRCSRAWSVLSRRELVQPVVNQKRLVEFAVKAAFFDPKDSIGHMTVNLALSAISINLSLKAAEEAHRIDPLYPYAAVYLTDSLIVLGRSKEALPLIDNLLGVDPDLQIALYYKAIILSNNGQTDEAAAILQRLETIMKEGRFPEDLLLVAQEIQALQKGDSNLAASLRKRIFETNDPVVILFDVDLTAPLLVRHGKTEEALQVLTRGLEVNMVPYDLLMMNPELNTLEKDARFQKIFAGSKARFQEIVTLLNQCKERGELPPYLNEPLADLSAKMKL